MRCRNFLCENHDSFNKLSKMNCVNEGIEDFLLWCESRKRYNRILDTRELRYKSNELNFYCVDIDQERNIYYGRTK